MPNDDVVPIAAKVLAIDHRLQFYLPTGPGASLTARYEQELRGLVSVFRPVLICEEAKHTATKSIAHSIADLLGHRYHNIDMTPSERQLRHIPSDYASYPPGMSKYSDQQIAGWHAEREAFMLCEILHALSLALPSRPLQLLVICGPCHFDRLSKALALKPAIGTITDCDMTQSDWFDVNLLS